MFPTAPGGASFTVPDRTVRVVNRSTSPIFNIAVDIFDHRTNTFVTSDVRRFAVMVAGDDHELALGAVPESASVLLRFRDLRGTWWRRFQNGHLEETHPNGIPKQPVGENTAEGEA